MPSSPAEPNIAHTHQTRSTLPYRRLSYRAPPRQALWPSRPSDPTTRSAPHALTNPNRRHGAPPLVRPCRCHPPPPRLNDPPRGCQLPSHATIRRRACLWHIPSGLVQMTSSRARVLGCMQCMAPSASHRSYLPALALASRSTNHDGVVSRDYDSLPRPLTLHTSPAALVKARPLRATACVAFPTQCLTTRHSPRGTRLRPSRMAAHTDAITRLDSALRLVPLSTLYTRCIPTWTFPG